MASSMNKKVLLIESGHYGEDINTLSDFGYDVIVLTTGVIPVKEEYLKAALEFHVDKNFLEYSTLSSKVKELITNHSDIVSIFTTSDFFVSQVSKICESFEYNHLSFDAASLFANKFYFRQKQMELGYLTPQFQFYTNYEDGSKFIKNNPQKLPLVFKPVTGNESIGVQLILSEEDLKKCCKELLLHSKFSKNMISKEYLLEEFIEGEVVSVEFIKTNNELFLLGVTDRVMSSPPYFIELGYSFPCELIQKESLYNETRKIVQDFGYNFGPGHIEFIITPNHDIYILEVNARLVGWPISKMISDSFKKNIFLILVELYETGNITNFSNNTYSACTCLEVTAPDNGRLIDYQIPLDYIEDPSITFYFFKNKGDVVKTPKSNTDLIMRFIVEAPTYHLSTERANSLYNSIILEIEGKQMEGNKIE